MLSSELIFFSTEEYSKIIRLHFLHFHFNRYSFFYQYEYFSIYLLNFCLLFRTENENAAMKNGEPNDDEIQTVWIKNEHKWSIDNSIAYKVWLHTQSHNQWYLHVSHRKGMNGKFSRCFWSTKQFAKLNKKKLIYRKKRKKKIVCENISATVKQLMLTLIWMCFVYCRVKCLFVAWIWSIGLL